MNLLSLAYIDHKWCIGVHIWKCVCVHECVYGNIRGSVPLLDEPFKTIAGNVGMSYIKSLYGNVVIKLKNLQALV